MKNKFTPGPWSYRKNPMRDDGWFVNGANGETGITFTQTSEADARLISAAPEMLEALERVEVMLKSNRDAESDFLLTLIQPAIAKAKGEQS